MWQWGQRAWLLRFLCWTTEKYCFLKFCLLRSILFFFLFYEPRKETSPNHWTTHSYCIYTANYCAFFFFKVFIRKIKGHGQKQLAQRNKWLILLMQLPSRQLSPWPIHDSFGNVQILEPLIKSTVQQQHHSPPRPSILFFALYW